jgi:iron complex outermembrane receptor protein
MAQEGGLAGMVTAEQSGANLSNVEVEVLGPDGVVVAGGLTATRGTYRITGIPAGTYTVSFTLAGWALVEEAGITITAGQTTSLNVAMTERSFNLNPITVTASRRTEKALEAPAAIEVVTREDIAARPAVTPVDHVKEQAGVDFVNTGLQSNYVVVRGFNNIFSGATLNLTDFRISRVPSLRVNISHLTPTTSSDIDRVEVVLGPGSALYGPNAANGVIHYLTQSPIDDPGVNLSLASGVRRQGDTSDGISSSNEVTWQGEGRLAWANADETFGLKLSGQYFTGVDYAYNDPVEQSQQELADACIAAGYNPVNAACFQFTGDLNPATPEGQADLRTRVDNVAGGRDYDLERYAFDARVDFRPSPETSVVINGGVTNALNSVDLTGIGAGQVQSWKYYYAQGRFNWKRLFGQVFWNKNDNDDTYLLRSGRPLVDKSYQFVAQLQHGFDIAPQHGVTYGMDYLNTQPQSSGTINGRHEDVDDVQEFGGYVQYDGWLNDQWNVVAAARLDDHSALQDPVFSPRAAIVFKPTPERSIRASYNRAFSTPTTLNLFLDISAQNIPLIPGTPFFYDARAQGVSKDGFTFNRDANNVPQHMSPFAPLVGASPRDFLPSTTEQVWSEAVAVVRLANPQAAALLDLAGTPGPTQVPVFGATLDLNSQDFINPVLDLSTVEDVPALEPTIWQTFEVGYKGLLLGSNLLLGVNGYYTDVDNFVSALETFTPNLFLPETPIDAYLQGQLLPLVGLVPGLDSATVIATAGLLAESMSGVPYGSVVPTTAGGSTAAPVLLTYRNLGDFSYFGADASFTYVLNDRWEFGGTISWVEKDTFLTGEEGDPNTREVALNAPKWKGSAILGYRDPGSGWNGAVRGRFIDGFPVASGVYTSYNPATETLDDIPGYSVFDFNVGYTFKGRSGVSIQLDISNIFDKSYRSFVGVPEFGRYGVIRLMWAM